MEASPRLELGMRILQTLALPLGYDAIFLWSGRRDSDPRLSPWQGDTLPLSHSRRIDCPNTIPNVAEFCNKFLKVYFFLFKSASANFLSTSLSAMLSTHSFALLVSSSRISLATSSPTSFTNELSAPSRRSSAIWNAMPR